MIVNLQTDGWEIIYHRAHALLAAQIAGHWDFSKKTYRLYETIAAIAHHDHLEKEWEGDQLTPAGAPLDFTLGTGSSEGTSHEKLRDHVNEALYQGRWVAMLISMHLCFLNQDKGEDDPQMASFLKEQCQHQTQWQAELEVTKEEAEKAYTFMRWCDRLSLILSQRQIPTGGRHLEIIQDSDGSRYSIYELDSGDLSITPWPFSCDKFRVMVDACYLSQLKFNSNSALTKALVEAPRKTLAWTLKKV